jgi:hypothetical protein
MCAALLDAARPNEEALREFIEEYKRTKAEAVVEPRSAAYKGFLHRPLVDAMWVEVSVIFVTFGLAAVVSEMFGDQITTSVLSKIAARSIVSIFAVAVAFLFLTYCAVRWLGLGRSKGFQRFGGLIAGGGFAAISVLYIANLSFGLKTTYSELNAAQKLLLQDLAMQIHSSPGGGSSSVA